MFLLEVGAPLESTGSFGGVSHRDRLFYSHMLFCQTELVEELSPLILLLGAHVDLVEVSMEIGLILKLLLNIFVGWV